MSRTRLGQKGFEPVFVILLVVVVAAAGLIAYRVAGPKKTATNKSVESVAPTVKTKSDITNAKKSLDELPVDKDVNPSDLDSDLSALQ